MGIKEEMAKSQVDRGRGNGGRRTGLLLLSRCLFLGLAVVVSAGNGVWAAPSQPNPSPVIQGQQQPPVITAPPILQIRQNDPQIQVLSQQLQELSSASRQVSQSSQQLSITSAQLVNSVQQLSNRLVQTEQSVIALRASVNNVEQASRSLSQQVAEVSRSADRQMSERLQRASQTMVENMSSMAAQMESSFARRLVQASRSAVALSQGRVEQPDNALPDPTAGFGFGPEGTASPPPPQVQGMRTEVVIGAVVGGVLGSMVLSIIGVFFGLKIRQRQQKQGRIGPGIGPDTFMTGGASTTANRGGSPNIGNPVLQSTSNKAYASVGLGPGGINNKTDKEKEMGVGGKRMSDASSVYSSDFDDDEKVLLKQEQPSPATLAKDAPDLRRLVLERSNTAISRKSVGGQQKAGFAMSYYGSSATTIPPPPPKAVGTGAIKGLNNNNNTSNDNVNNEGMNVMTPTTTTIVKTGGSKVNKMMKGFQLGQPPPGKLSLFPKSDGGGSSSSSGGSSPVDSEDGKGTAKRLESWLRRERGVVSPFAMVPPKKK